jgi:hypothetical protein
VAQLKTEREMLRTASAYFARETMRCHYMGDILGGGFILALAGFSVALRWCKKTSLPSRSSVVDRPGTMRPKTNRTPFATAIAGWADHYRLR